jgi:excisionase family DNA binding protein
VPTEELARQAKVAARGLAHMLKASHASVSIQSEARPERITVPREAFELFVDLLGHLANGNGVAVYPVDAELTTQQAADMLNVSRPYLVRLLEESKLPFHKVGTHRRIRLPDLLNYIQRDRAERTKAIDDLAAMAQEDNDY